MKLCRIVQWKLRCGGGMLRSTMLKWKLTQYHHTTIAGVTSGFSSHHGIDAVTNCCHLLIRRCYSSSDNSIGYERKSPVEHVLLRPGMYIGATEFTSLDTWVFNQQRQTMERKAAIYNPALLKIFDEILVNAADNKQRGPDMSRIHVSISYDLQEELVITVDNDGRGIPVQKHPTERIYIPELIFGHLLTGSNFDDKQARLTGGSHGYGAKLTNIFSKSFQVETYDNKAGLLYKQVWSKNMSSVTPPLIEKRKSSGVKGLKSYTKVSFTPDLRCFIGDAWIVYCTIVLFYVQYVLLSS